MLTSQINRERQKNGSWTKEACRNAALKCKTRSESQRKYGSAYPIAVRNRWLIEICSQMTYLKTPDGSWTKDTCQEAALKCKTRSEFIKKYPGAYDAARNQNIIEDIFSHMISAISPTWTKVAWQKESSKYDTKNQFRNNSGAYYAAQRRGWLDEICSPMKRPANRYKKLIYAYEFPDRPVYIGLTFDIDDLQSHRDHDYGDAVTKYIKQTNLRPVSKILTNFIPVDNAIKSESKFIRRYRRNCWEILNKATAAAIGGTVLKWTFNSCQEEALKYKSKSEFQKNNSSAYSMQAKKLAQSNLHAHETIDKPKWHLD